MTGPAIRPSRGRGRVTVIVACVVAVVVVTVAAVVLISGGPDDGAPAEADFIRIAQAPVRAPAPGPGPDASTGSFESRCGRNENAHLNADNMITSPGLPHAAEHGHEYVGNLATDAFATDAVLAAAGTTCTNGDLSTYSWPVLRTLTGETGAAAGHGNTGTRVVPASVLVQFRGSAVSKVVTMPRFLRVITGNAHAGTVTTVPRRVQWGCTDVVDRSTELYPLCPSGQQVLRTYDFPSCWDGRRTDSPNHREHVVFPAANGVCPRDTYPVPQLHVEIRYVVPPGRSFAIDTFPAQHRSPTTDHADFINVMPDTLMAEVVACVNSGQHC